MAWRSSTVCAWILLALAVGSAVAESTAVNAAALGLRGRRLQGPIETVVCGKCKWIPGGYTCDNPASQALVKEMIRGSSLKVAFTYDYCCTKAPPPSFSLGTSDKAKAQSLESLKKNNGCTHSVESMEYVNEKGMRQSMEGGGSLAGCDEKKTQPYECVIVRL